MIIEYGLTIYLATQCFHKGVKIVCDGHLPKGACDPTRFHSKISTSICHTIYVLSPDILSQHSVYLFPAQATRMGKRKKNSRMRAAA